MMGFATLAGKDGGTSVGTQALTWVCNTDGATVLLEVAGSKAACRAIANNISGRYMGDYLKPTRVSVQYTGGTDTVMRQPDQRFNMVPVPCEDKTMTRILVIDRGFGHLFQEFFLGPSAPDGEIPPMPRLFERAFAKLPIAVKSDWLPWLWKEGYRKTDPFLIQPMKVKIGHVNGYALPSKDRHLEVWRQIIKTHIAQEN